jgi:hypothetical protein
MDSHHESIFEASWLSWTFSHESPSNFISKIRNKMINWNTKSQIRNYMIQAKLSYYTFHFFTTVFLNKCILFTIIKLNMCIFFTIIMLNMCISFTIIMTNCTSMSAWTTTTLNMLTLNEIALQTYQFKQEPLQFTVRHESNQSISNLASLE